jgi:hypothetical protein
LNQLPEGKAVLGILESSEHKFLKVLFWSLLKKIACKWSLFFLVRTLLFRGFRDGVFSKFINPQLWVFRVRFLKDEININVKHIRVQEPLKKAS